MKILPNIPKTGIRVRFSHHTIFLPRKTCEFYLHVLPEVGDNIAILLPGGDEHHYTIFRVDHPRIAIHNIKENDVSYNFSLMDI